MAKLRKIQFYRNGGALPITNDLSGALVNGKEYIITNLKSAYVYAEAVFKHTGKYNEMEDGEILLYRFSYDGTVHTLVGVVHAGATKSLEVLANYDMLGAEISNEISAAINALDVENVSVATEADGIVTFNGIKQEDGKIATGTTGISLAKVATTGAAADVAVTKNETLGLTSENVQAALEELQGDINAINGKTITAVENQAVDVTTDEETGNTTIGLLIPTAEKVLSQTADGLVTTLTVDTKKYPTESTAEGYVAGKAGKTFIQIKGIGGEVISETDAAAFVKDGFLESVTKDAEKNELVFTWNTDAGVQETTISIKDLCDVYTVGEGLVATEEGYKFSHQAGATGLTANTVFGSGLATANKITVKVPSVTVDKFGHVSALSETEVSLEIPDLVASAVQDVTGDDYVTATKSGTNVKLTTITGDVADGENKLATAQSVKSYVDEKIAGLDTPENGVTGSNNGVSVTVNQVDGVITSVSVNASELNTAIETLEGRMDTAEGDIDALEGRMTTAESDIDALEKRMDTAEGDIDLLEKRMDTAEGDIVALEERIDDQNYSHEPVNIDGITFTIFGTDQTYGQVSEFEDGIITFNQAVSTDNKAATMADVNAAIQATTYTQGNGISISDDNVVSANVAVGEQVLSVDVNGLKTTLTVDTKKYPTESTAEGYVAGKAGKTFIQIKGIGGEVISETDAAAFVKDGFLQSVVLDEENDDLVFTWNTDAEAGEENQVTRIAISKLCDVYTVKQNDWIQLDGFEFSHKTSNVTAGGYGAAADATLETAGESITFNVPSITVDAAGHITVAEDKAIKVALPAYIATAVQTVTSTETVNATDKFVAVKTTRADGSNEVVLTSEVKTQSIASADATADGLATALDVKQFVLDNSASVAETEGETTVAKSTTQPYTYTVGLADVTRVDNPTADGTAGNPSESSFADENNKFTYVKEVKTDDKGRVTGIVTETVTEDFDAGTY